MMMRKMMEESLVYTKIPYTRHNQWESLVVDFGQMGFQPRKKFDDLDGLNCNLDNIKLKISAF
jgi:hypothetical protein